ncbi:MAG: hypothetical protein AAFR46_17745 [Pseudomonadota bacterium]
MANSDFENKKLLELAAKFDALQSRLDVVSQNASLAAKLMGYAGLRLAVWVILMIFLLIAWALLLTPIGSYLGANDFTLEWISLAANSIDPACQGSACLDASPQYRNAARNAASSLQAANRNLMTVLLPVFLGIVIWLVTVVAERRLKTYDETIDRIRSGNDEARENLRLQLNDSLRNQRSDAEAFRQDLNNKVNELREYVEQNRNLVRETPDNLKRELNTEIQMLIETAMSGAKVEIENQSLNSKLEIVSIRDELNEQFKDVLHLVPLGEDMVALNS